MTPTASTLRLPNLLLAIRRLLPWLNLPAGALLALLQRTPAVQTVIRAGEQLVAGRGGEVLRAAFTVAGLGALHGRAGATTFIVTQGSTQIINATPQRTTLRNPATGTVGAAMTPVAITYTGTPSAPQYWVISGNLPQGLTVSPAPNLGVVRSATPAITGTPTQAGSFTFRAQGYGTGGQGSPEPIVFNITGAAATAPSITAQPQSQTARAGGSVTFSASASASPDPTYQWQRNGTTLPGATSASLALASLTGADAGTYRVIVTNAAGSVTSNEAALSVYTPNPSARLANLSVRTALAAADTLIVGLSVGGGSRDVLVRAVGPTLGAFGVGGTMADPRLELYNGQTRVFANDDWPLNLAPVFPTVGAFALGNGNPSKDAAFLQTINGTRSIWALGTGAGVVLVEAYDTGAPSAARLVNVSARNRVGTGDDIL
ncbi:MAG: immunoglobulin domain-containing protein, partial [Opitutaceae bacterium]